MVGFLDHHPKVGAVGPYTVDALGKIQSDSVRAEFTLLSALWEATLLYKVFPRSRIFGRHLMSWWDHTNSRAVDAVSGACIMVRQEVIEQVGMLDENFFMYGEDLDWCLRIKRGGWQVYFLTGAHITHLKNQSMGQISNKSLIEHHKAVRYYFEKNYGTRYASLSSSIYACGIGLRLAIWGSTWLLSPSHRPAAESRLIALKAALHCICRRSHPLSRHAQSVAKSQSNPRERADS